MEEEINKLSTSPNIVQFVLKKDAFFWNYNLSKYARRKDVSINYSSWLKIKEQVKVNKYSNKIWKQYADKISTSVKSNDKHIVRPNVLFLLNLLQCNFELCMLLSMDIANRMYLHLYLYVLFVFVFLTFVFPFVFVSLSVSQSSNQAIEEECSGHCVFAQDHSTTGFSRTRY